MKTLKPSLKLQTPTRLRVLEQKAGTTQRERGSSWMKKRRAALERDLYGCRACGHIGMDNEIDHIVPLEQGGSNSMHNLQTLCRDCHAAKTASEQRTRHGG